MGEMRNAYTILVGKLKEKDHLGDLGEDGMVILKWILKDRMQRWRRCVWFRIGTSGRVLRTLCPNEPPCSARDGNCFEQLSDY
jgi:hypothetical protein